MNDSAQDDDISTIEIKPSVVEGGNAERTTPLPKILLLIQLIASEPAIFNIRHEDHRNAFKKDEQWKIFSMQVGWTVKHCKNKWKALRDQYCRELKRARTNSKVVIKWKYFRYLEFLRPFALSRNYRSRRSAASNDSEMLLDHEEESLVENVGAEEENSLLHVKSEKWTSYNSDESTVVPSVMTDHSLGKLDVYDAIPDNDAHDDENDDPIHTFLNIESYFEKELIALVQTEEVLYNSKHTGYKNMKLKLEIWEGISRKLKRTVRQCRSKWKALRDQYIREHKRLLQIHDIKYSTRWKHYDALSFLKKFLRLKSAGYPLMKTQKTHGEIPHSHATGNDDASQIFNEHRQTNHQQNIDPMTNTSSTPIEQLPVTSTTTSVPESATSNDDNDEIGAFFRAIAMKIRKAKLSTMAFTELQIDILRVITNALRGHSDVTTSETSA